MLSAGGGDTCTAAVCVLDCEHVGQWSISTEKTKTKKSGSILKGNVFILYSWVYIKTFIWRKKLVCWRLTPTFWAVRFWLSEKVFGFHRCYRLFSGCCETLSVINGSLWIEQKALNHLIDALVIASLHTSFQALFLLRQVKMGKKESVKMTTGEVLLFWWKRRPPVFIPPHLTFVLNSFSGIRMI